MHNLTEFTLKQCLRKLNSINVEINLEHQRPFPKIKMASHYEYQFRYIRIDPLGYFNRARFVTSLINFTFIRSIVADCYSEEGRPPYDPCSMFVLDLIALLNGITIKELCNTIHDRNEGYAWRLYAGISVDRIPCEADFSNFRIRIGSQRYNAIFHILVQIVKILGMITGRILSHDSTLFHTFARYRGCNYACSECESIQVRDDNFINDVRYRINKLLENSCSIPLNKEMRAYAKCPRKEYLPQGVKPCSIIIIAFTILPFNEEAFTENDRQTARLLDPEDNLGKHNLMLKVLRSHISKIDASSWPYPVYVKCPKIPADLEAKIGCRRSKYNPDKVEKIFGFKATISTNIEPELALELPIDCIGGAGSDHDSHHFFYSKEQTKEYHSFATIFDIADSGFDDESVYEYIRDHNSIPIIDYNRRREKISPEILLARGYDQNGYPFAPCECTCKSNGYSKEEKRLSCVCGKQCLSNPQAVPKPIPDCPYLQKPLGYARHMSIVQHPRLVCEIPRGSEKWKKIRTIRSSSERTNSTTKSDLDVLDHPRVMGLERAKILAQMACIVTLLKRVMHFISKVTLDWRKYISSNDKRWWKALQLRKIPDFLDSMLHSRAPPA